MGRIASDITIAEQASQSILGTSDQTGHKIMITESNIPALSAGAEVANNVLPNLKNLTDCVKKYASKFPQLASIIEARDQSTRFN